MGREVVVRYNMEGTMIEGKTTIKSIRIKNRVYQVVLGLGEHTLLSPKPFDNYTDVKDFKDALVAFIGGAHPDITLILVDREKVDACMKGELSESQVRETGKTVHVQWVGEVVVSKPTSREVHFYRGSSLH